MKTLIFESRKRKPARRKPVKRRRQAPPRRRRLTKGFKLAHHVKVITICVVVLFILMLVSMIMGDNSYVLIAKQLGG